MPTLNLWLNFVEKGSKMTIMGDRDFFDQYLADFWQVAGGSGQNLYMMKGLDLSNRSTTIRCAICDFY